MCQFLNYNIDWFLFLLHSVVGVKRVIHLIRHSMSYCWKCIKRFSMPLRIYGHVYVLNLNGVTLPNISQKYTSITCNRAKMQLHPRQRHSKVYLRPAVNVSLCSRSVEINHAEINQMRCMCRFHWISLNRYVQQHKRNVKNKSGQEKIISIFLLAFWAISVWHIGRLLELSKAYYPYTLNTIS